MGAYNCKQSKCCKHLYDYEQGENTILYSEVHNDNRPSHKLSSRGNVGKGNVELQNNGKEEALQPSGVRVNQNTDRNLERGDQCEVDIDKIRKNEEASPSKKKSSNLKIPLGFESENERISPEERKIIEERNQKIREEEKLKAKKLEEAKQAVVEGISVVNNYCVFLTVLYRPTI